MNKNFLYYILLASMLIMAAAGKSSRVHMMCLIFYVPSISLIQLSYFAFSRFKGQEQEIDSSYDSSSGDDDIMDLDEDLEELDLEESSSGEHVSVRYLRKGWPGRGQHWRLQLQLRASTTQTSSQAQHEPHASQPSSKRVESS